MSLLQMPRQRHHHAGAAHICGAPAPTVPLGAAAHRATLQTQASLAAAGTAAGVASSPSCTSPPEPPRCIFIRSGLRCCQHKLELESAARCRCFGPRPAPAAARSDRRAACFSARARCTPPGNGAGSAPWPALPGLPAWMRSANSQHAACARSAGLGEITSGGSSSRGKEWVLRAEVRDNLDDLQRRAAAGIGAAAARCMRGTGRVWLA